MDDHQFPIHVTARTAVREEDEEEDEDEVKVEVEDEDEVEVAGEVE